MQKIKCISFRKLLKVNEVLKRETKVLMTYGILDLHFSRENVGKKQYKDTNKYQFVHHQEAKRPHLT